MASNVIWQPQPKQALFMSRPEDEALYGGAAGGGKSDALVIEATRQVEIPHYKGLILRKTFPQLTELIEKSLLYYPPAFPGARYNDSKHTWTFPSGAKIVFGSMQYTKDKQNYQGKAYDFIAFDELTHFTHAEYIYLLSRNRANGPGTRCYMRATANPGGIGHGWVKDRFITAAHPMKTIWEKVKIQMPDGQLKEIWKSRIFVPSSVFDNQALLTNDPGYLANLAALPEAEKKALLYGDWDSFTGQYFTEFRDDPEHYGDHLWTHVIEPFEVPDTWEIYRSFDWGFAKPFSCDWWAMDHDGRAYLILQYYGCTGEPNVGIKMNPGDVFAEIARIEREHRWLKGKRILGVADTAIWASDGGPAIIESAEANSVYFEQADKTRIPGWMQMHYRFAFDETGRPMMYFFNTCKAAIRTIPLLQYSERVPEDLDTEGEDHFADSCRYFCMMRPLPPKKKQEARYRRYDPLNQFEETNNKQYGLYGSMRR